MAELGRAVRPLLRLRGEHLRRDRVRLLLGADCVRDGYFGEAAKPRRNGSDRRGWR